MKELPVWDDNADIWNRQVTLVLPNDCKASKVTPS
jgi:hypothetical protein